jgi:hypothetical protein
LPPLLATALTIESVLTILIGVSYGLNCAIVLGIWSPTCTK